MRTFFFFFFGFQGSDAADGPDPAPVVSSPPTTPIEKEPPQGKAMATSPLSPYIVYVKMHGIWNFFDIFFSLFSKLSRSETAHFSHSNAKH